MANVKKYPTQGKKGKRPTTPLKVACLGGLAEIGKNMTVLEYGDDIIVIDCGMGFPDEDMPGVDLVIPDVSYLVANAHKVRGILITHGHEDHIGAIPYTAQDSRSALLRVSLTKTLRPMSPSFTQLRQEMLSLSAFSRQSLSM